MDKRKNIWYLRAVGSCVVGIFSLVTVNDVYVCTKLECAFQVANKHSQPDPFYKPITFRNNQHKIISAKVVVPPVPVPQ